MMLKYIIDGVVLFLIITIVITLVIINYKENEFYETDYIIDELFEDRCWNVFDEEVFDSINVSDVFEQDLTGEFVELSDKLIRGYDSYRFYKKLHNTTIASGTLVIFPRNDGISWENSEFYLTDTVTKQDIYPEPNSLLVARNDLIVSKSCVNLILGTKKK